MQEDGKDGPETRGRAAPVAAGLIGCALAPIALWSLLGIAVIAGNGFAWGVALVVVAAALLGGPAGRRVAAGTILVVAVLTLLWVFARQPRDDRQWWAETSRVPEVRMEAEGRFVDLKNVRAFRWRRYDLADPAEWIERRVDLHALSRVELVLEPFPGNDRFAHSMLSFSFDDGSPPLVVSVEARKEQGERFGLLPGLFRQFELIYVLADEQDVLGKRAIDGRRLYLFPIRADREWVRELFVDLVTRAAALQQEPAFYHSLRSNCTTALLQHVNRRLDPPIPLGREIVFNGRAAAWLHRHGYLDTELEFEAALARFRVDAQVRKALGEPQFSRRIRDAAPTAVGPEDAGG